MIKYFRQQHLGRLCTDCKKQQTKPGYLVCTVCLNKILLKSLRTFKKTTIDATAQWDKDDRILAVGIMTFILTVIWVPILLIVANELNH